MLQHNVFDQLRNLVTMPSASGDDARGGGAAADGAVPALAPGAKPASGDCAPGSPTRSKSGIRKASEESLPKGKPSGTSNGNHKQSENSAGKGQDANGAPTTAAAAMEPGTSLTGNIFAKSSRGSSLVTRSFEMSGLPGRTANGRSATKGAQKPHTDSTVVVASRVMSARRVNPRPKGLSRRHAVPEPGSLFDIIVKNPRTRLFVRPMAWVDDHARHLNVTWRALPDVDTVPLPPAALSAYYDIHNIHLDVNRIFLPCTRNEAPIGDVLPRLYPRGSLLSLRADSFSEMRMWFDSRVYRFAMRVECLWRWPFHPHERDPGASFATESTLDAWSDDEGSEGVRRSPPHGGKPMLAYVGRDWLKGLRSRHPRVVPGHPANGPVTRLGLLQEKQLLPADPERDPRFASILIAMAQEHVYPSSCPAPARFPGTVPPRLDVAPEFRDVTVRLLVHGLNGDFIVYRATVPADYLRRFHHPLRAFGGGSPGLEIEMTRVAESPRLGLRERLGAALGEDVVGPIFEDLVVREREHLTPDTERWTPQPEDGDGPPANGVASARETVAEGVEQEGQSAANARLGEGGSETRDSPGRGKRQRKDHDTPCLDGTCEDSGDRSGKKRRLHDEKRETPPLSN